jgi:4-amino-4-deoxy-L-arabinose transferase-like glycosyltransferase
VLGLSALIALFPWTGFLPQAIGRVFRTNQSTRQALRRTLFASAITALGFFAVSSSKLPSYALVAVPPLAVLIGLWFDEELDAARSSLSSLAQSTVVLAIGATVLLLAPLVIGRFVTTRQLLGAIRPDSPDVGTFVAPITVPLGLAFAVALVAVILLRGLRGRVIGMAVAGACIPLMAVAYAQPILRNIYPWERLGARVETGHGGLWLVGRKAPSLTFYARQPVITLNTGADLEPLVERETEGWLAMSRQEWSVFATTAAAKRARAAVVAESGRMLLVRFHRTSAAS